jgi:serine/threonine protein kinase
MVQEYLQGQSLREALEKGALPLDKALDFATEVAEALVAAHEAGIVHRDLKPDNIFVTEQGHAKVLDFGLAKLMEMSTLSGSASMSPTMLGTVAGQVMGTAGYMAPEQVNGEEVDHRADLFAFGCVLYESVTGRRAFAGASVVQTLSKIAHEEPEPVSQIVATTPAELGRIVRKCLAKEPAKRYQAAGELVIDLQALAADVESGTAMPLGGSRTRRTARGNGRSLWRGSPNWAAAGKSRSVAVGTPVGPLAGAQAPSSTSSSTGSRS